MNILAFIITTLALMSLAVFYAWYMNTYIATNIINTAEYTLALINSALEHELQNAITIASISDVVGSFNYTLMLPTSAIPVQGVALTYTVTLYPTTVNQGGTTLILLNANVTVTMYMGPIFRIVRSTVTLYSSTQPYEIIAYNCQGINTPVTLVNPQWTSTGLPNPAPQCTWTSANVVQGNAIIEVVKNT